MSKLAVANIIFETTEANRIEYTGNNVVRVRANGGLQIPFGTTDQRVSPEYGIIRYNTDLQTVEMYDAGGWYNMPTGGYVNSIYTVANSAYAAANNVAPQIAPAFSQANLAYTSSNVVYAAVNSAFGSINSNWAVTNTVYGVANAAFNAANNVGPQIAPAFNQANTAFAASNSANSFANSTYVKLTAPNQTITGDLAITGNLTLLGNATTITSNNLIVNDSLIYLAANNDLSDVLDIGFVGHYSNGTANLHTGLFRDHSTKQYFLFNDLAGPEPETINDLVPYANGMINAVLNANFVTSNLTLGGANAINWITSGYGVANAAFGKANTALQNASGTFAGSLTVTGNMITGGRVTASSQGGNFVYPADSGYEWWIGAWNDLVSYQITRRNTSSGTGYPYFIIGTTGNVGIGTTSPSQKLDVAGNINTNQQYKISSSYASELGSSEVGFMWHTSGPVITYIGANDYIIKGSGADKFRVYNTGPYSLAYGSMRSPIFYDSDDTGYYVNPNGTSYLYGLTVATGYTGAGSTLGSTAGSPVLYSNGQTSRSYEAHDFNTYPNLYSTIFCNLSASSNIPTGAVSAAMGYRFVMGSGDTTTRGFDLVGTSGVGTSVAGELFFRERATGTWNKTWHNNNAPGTVLQVNQSVKTDTFASSSTTFVDVTGMAVTITPKSTSSKIIVTLSIHGVTSNLGYVKLQRNGTDIAIGDAASNRIRCTVGNFNFGGDGNTTYCWNTEFIDSPATTSAVTYKLQFRHENGGSTWFVNRTLNDADSAAGFRPISTITVKEIAQ